MKKNNESELNYLLVLEDLVLAACGLKSDEKWLSFIRKEADEIPKNLAAFRAKKEQEKEKRRRERGKQ